jgi:hypothetical protein
VRAVLAACVFLASCAAPQKAEAPLRPGEIVSATVATKTITVGKSTKADVRAALGEAVVIDFDSGYEVWVYRERPREKATAPANELVLLFAPSGILTKTRIR